MLVHTSPRELAARWIKPGDEVATYEVETGAGDQDSGVRDFARSEDLVLRHPALIDWWLVVDGSKLVPPPADAEVGRVEGGVKLYAGGAFDVEPMARGFVPDGIDHVGTHQLVLMPIQNATLGPPRTAYIREEEQLVIRERVRLEGHPETGGITSAQRDADTRLVLALLDADPAVTARLPVAQVPVGVFGIAPGRELPETAIDFVSERDSDEFVSLPPAVGQE